MNLMSIFHVDSHNKYAMGMCNISRAMDTITFISPENNNWILDSILKKYNNNKTSMINHMAYASVNELDINQLVYTVNKHDEMVRVNKVAVGDDVVHIFESESICGLLTQNEIYMVECKEYTDFRRVVADIMMGLKEHFGSRHNIVVI
jgi:predicted flavoprotein YhiN